MRRARCPAGFQVVPSAWPAVKPELVKVIWCYLSAPVLTHTGAEYESGDDLWVPAEDDGEMPSACFNVCFSAESDDGSDAGSDQ